MMLFMSKYSKNVDFFVLIKKIFLIFLGVLQCSGNFCYFFKFFFHNFLSLYVVMMLFMSKYSKNVDFLF